jgi:hypothetical protein
LPVLNPPMKGTSSAETALASWIVCKIRLQKRINQKQKIE